MSGTGAYISTCWACRERIQWVAGEWRHKPTGSAHSVIGGDHVASPTPPDDDESDDG